MLEINKHIYMCTALHYTEMPLTGGKGNRKSGRLSFRRPDPRAGKCCFDQGVELTGSLRRGICMWRVCNEMSFDETICRGVGGVMYNTVDTYQPPHSGKKS